MVSYFVEHGAAVDASSSSGRTPLMRAADMGKLEVVRFLAEHGAAVDARSNSGRTPLMRASRYGNLDMVRFLVERGAVVDIRDNQGWSPLMWAAENGDLNVVRYLMERGADVDGCDNEGWTSLMRAARDGDLGMVRFLVQHEANVNLMTNDDNTALSIADNFGSREIVQFLLPLVRYQDGRAETENRNRHATVSFRIPSGWLISPFEIEVEPFIDGAIIGGDYRGKWLDADVVVKLFVADISSATFVDEVRLWHQLRHPNILKLYGVCNSHHHLFVCEYASRGSLPDYLKACDAECRTPWKFMYEAALGLEYLLERKIVHGDLKGNNILIGSDGLAKLSGFTLSTSPLERGMHKTGDQVRWLAPEILSGEHVSPASDVYSLGMCIVEAVSGMALYDGWDEMRIKFMTNNEVNAMNHLKAQLACSTPEQQELVLSMCVKDPRKRVQIPVVVNKLEQFAAMENTEAKQCLSHYETESLAKFGEFDIGKTSSLWTEVQTLVEQSKNPLYHQLWHELEMIHDILNAERHLLSILQRFHELLSECRNVIDALSQQSLVRRLSATRARDNSIRSLHRHINQLLQLVRPHDQDVETREMEWKRLCREQVEIFVSEASEACVLLSSVDSEENRSALAAVLRAELRNSDVKYTEKQLAVLQKTYDTIISASFQEMKNATTPEWFIPWFELEMNEMANLGEGGFGSVFKAKWLDSEVVVKKLEIADRDAANADKKREMRQMFEREVDIWFGLSHPHVVRLFGACHVGRPFFVCELAPNGTLDEYLRRHPDELWSKFREAALGVQYLHARGVVHGDLKGNNILVGSDGKAKVTDFGLSGVFGDDSTEIVISGAWHWVAPECILGDKPTFASDIYSFGMCIIEALRVTNSDEFYLPWGKLPNPAVKFHVTKNHCLPQRPGNCSDEAWTLIESMCKCTAADRMLIMTAVDELEKLAGRHRDLSGETDRIVGDIGKMRLSSSSLANTLAEMQDWITTCDTKSDWEGDVLKNIYQLLWDRLEQVTTQILFDSEDTTVAEATISDLSALVEHSKQQTQAALGVTGVIPLVKFTELALGEYALHRRLDKFMAAHAVPKSSNPIHDWTSECRSFMAASADPLPACSKEVFTVNEETGEITSMLSARDVDSTMRENQEY